MQLHVLRMAMNLTFAMNEGFLAQYKLNTQPAVTYIPTRRSKRAPEPLHPLWMASVMLMLPTHKLRQQLVQCMRGELRGHSGPRAEHSEPVHD